ncbi:MAG TPA: hypothetical protein VMM78_03745 [Thermomicrobiales bacterium]|nr:hypothetical protein [Thermomicrobiales bacterium]
MAIHRVKYLNEPARAEWCAAEINGLLAERINAHTVLVPVALHHERLRERGYNQSLEICDRLARRDGARVLDALVRVRRTRSQVGLDSVNRFRNVEDAFATRVPLEGLSVVLIDDVVTTGSTLVACAIACRRAGARDVHAMTVATGL